MEGGGRRVRGRDGSEGGGKGVMEGGSDGGM